MGTLISQLLLPFSHSFLRGPALPSTFFPPSVPGRCRHTICHRTPSVLDTAPGDLERRPWKAEVDEQCLHWKVAQSGIQSWHGDKTKAPAGWTMGGQRSPESALKASLQKGSRGRGGGGRGAELSWEARWGRDGLTSALNLQLLFLRDRTWFRLGPLERLWNCLFYFFK